jgi:DNA-binding transcriptional MerR regulator
VQTKVEVPVIASMEGMLRIGEVADRVGLSLRSVRFYEESGLLVPEARSEGGFRLYTETQVDRLLLIKRMKPLGFRVEQMRELLNASDTLRSADSTRAEQDEARKTIREFAVLAAERCEELRTQLSRADEFAKRLLEETLVQAD